MKHNAPNYSFKGNKNRTDSRPLNSGVRPKSAATHAKRAMSTGASKVIQVRVKPGARTCAFGETDSGVWLAQLKSQPVDGKANAELIGLIAKHFGVPKSAVEIKSGASGRTKLVRIGVG